MASQREWYLVDSKGERSPASISFKHFKIFAPPKTDIWRPSPTQDDFNAPFLYTSIKCSEFKSLQTTVSADWKTLYDQGGLLIVWPGQDAKSKWVKIGIEHFTGKPLMGVVGCDRFSDWSVSLLPIASAVHATVLAERVDTTLWVYLVFNGERRPLREIKWAFLEERETDAEMWVGAYAAKPTSEKDDPEKGIEVIFRDLSLETAT